MLRRNKPLIIAQKSPKKQSLVQPNLSPSNTSPTYTHASAAGTACVGGGWLGNSIPPSPLAVSKLPCFSTPDCPRACVDKGPTRSICANECHNSAALRNVHTVASHKNTTLATARPLLAYRNGLPSYSASNRAAFAASVPVTYARLAATMYVVASADESISAHATTEHARHAVFTARDSWRAGQMRSKKKAAPKRVETKMPTKMLYDAMPM